MFEEKKLTGSWSNATWELDEYLIENSILFTESVSFRSNHVLILMKQFLIEG